MKKMKKLILAGAALFTLAFTFLGISSLNPVMVKAEDTFYMDGASVRTTDPSGIRFHTVVKDGAKDGCSYGTLLIPKADFTGETLTVDTPNVVDIPATRWQSETEFTVALGGVETNGVISNFPKAQYNNEIYACSYEKDANGVYTYTQMTSRVLAQVASVSLTDNTEEDKITDTEKRAYLEDICDYVLGADGFAFAQNSIDLTVGEKLDLTSVFATTNGNEGLKAIWEVTEGADYITVEKDDILAMTGLVAKTADGTVTLKATIGSYEQVLTLNVTEREIAVNEVVDFKYASDVNNASNKYNITSYEFVESYQGKEGVLKVKAGEWSYLGIVPLQDLSAYANYKYFVARIWTEDISAVDPLIYIAGDNANKASYNSVMQGAWVDYCFKAQDFIDGWTLGGNKASLDFKRPGTYYIDKIYMSDIYVSNVEEVNYFDVEPTGVTVVGGPKTEYLDSFEGAQGVLKVISPNWGITYFPAIKSIHDYSGYNRVVMRIWSENAGCNFDLNNDGNDYAINTYKTSVAGQWYDYYFTFEDFKEAWSRGDSYKGLFTFGTGGTYYIDAVYATNTAPISNGEILSFDSPADIGNIGGKTGSSAYGQVEWLESAHGESGVAKLTYVSNNDKWQGFTFKPIIDMSNYADYTHIVIRARTVKNSENASIYVGEGLNFGNSTGVDKQPIGYEGWTYDDKWIDYKFEIAPFLNAWTLDGSVNADSGTARIWFKAAALNGTEVTGTGYIYIAEIYAIKE